MFLSYEAYFQEPVGQPLFLVRGTQRVVGSHLRVGNGNLLFIPSFLGEEYYEYYDMSEAEAEEATRAFIESLVVLTTELRKSTGDFELPSWSAAYALPGEGEEKSKLLKLNENLNEIMAEISKQKELIAELEKNKILFAGTGPALEIQVRKVFEDLGFTITEETPGRDDLILVYEGRTVRVRG